MLGPKFVYEVAQAPKVDYLVATPQSELASTSNLDIPTRAQGSTIAFGIANYVFKAFLINFMENN